jgi:hypothetical protein
MLSRRKIRFIQLLCAFALTVPMLLPPVLAASEQTEVKQETGFYYTVKKGDTLWDISNHFFDSPQLWPDLWSQNRQISNPHLIYPGNRLHLFIKEGVLVIEEAPEEETEIVQEEAPIEVEEEPVEEPAYTENEPAKDLPSFPYEQINSIGFIKEKPIAPHAYIFKVRDDKQLISVGDTVYLKQEEDEGPELIPGSLYAVFRIMRDPVRDPQTNDKIGYQHYLKGVVEIKEILSQTPLIAEAVVVKNYQSMKRKDRLMPFKWRSPEITLAESPEGLTGKILLSQDHSRIFATHHVAFIDKGEQDGVMRGQEYDIFSEEQIDVIQKEIDIGKLLVLHTEQTTSTVVITNSTRAITPGTKIRSAMMP